MRGRNFRAATPAPSVAKATLVSVSEIVGSASTVCQTANRKSWLEGTLSPKNFADCVAMMSMPTPAV